MTDKFNLSRLDNENGSIYRNKQIRRLAFLCKIIQQEVLKYNQAICVELGAYPGTLGWLLQTTNITLDAIDIVAKSIPEVNLKYYRHIIDADIEKPIVEYQYSYDIALSFAVIEHLANNPLKYLENSWKLLKPGGRLLIQTPNKSYVVHRFKALLGKTIDESPLNAYLTKIYEGFFGHVILYNMHELKEMLEYAGFSIENSYYFNSYNGSNHLKRLLINIFSVVPSFRNQFVIVARKV
ncbi:MAG: class I SAM-dependent methyltransferase [Desulfobacterales bacterium]|nr:class I SAM-dependent methyltransferase [Desulfobacterales bacterium]